MNFLTILNKACLILLLVLLANFAGDIELAAENEDAVTLMQKVNDKWMQDHPNCFNSGFDCGDANWIRSVYHIGNIAQYKTGFPVETVSATGTQDPPPTNCCDPDHTIDNNLETRWSAFGDSHEGEEISIVYDLRRVRPVSHVRIAWLHGDRRTAYFEIHVSSDFETWEPVIPNGKSNGNTLEQQIFAFEERFIRYVKYIGKGNSLNNWNSITEFDVARGKYYQQSLNWAQANIWETFEKGDGVTAQGAIGDWIACGQSYIELYNLSPTTRGISWIADINDKVINFTQSRLNNDSCYLPKSTTMRPRSGIRWIDEIFMALPNFSKLGDLAIDGKPVFLRPPEFYWDRMYRDESPMFPKMSGFYGIQKDPDTIVDGTRISRGLYDPDQSLWYRDELYKKGCGMDFDKDDDRGVLWSRGNGWVIAGLAQMLDTLPNDPDRADWTEYIGDFRAMAAELKHRQLSNGAWQMDLEKSTHPDFSCGETSGTAFFTYALAWGINHGHLDRAGYEEVLSKAWNWLSNDALLDNDTLSNVQKVGRAPFECKNDICEPFTCNDLVSTESARTEFAIGAFLLAASEVSKLDFAPVPGPLSIKHSIEASTFQGPNTPGNTVDDDLHTRWSAFGDGEWIAYDLGHPRMIRDIEIAWFKGDQREAAFDVDICRSVDAEDCDWQTVVARAISSGKTADLEKYAFPAIEGRHLRVVGHENDTNQWNSITEVKVSCEETPMNCTPSRFGVIIVSAFQDPNTPGNTVDDDLDTRWSALGDGEWIAYDLGGVRTIREIEIAWYRGNRRSAFFDIEVCRADSFAACDVDNLWQTALSGGESSGESMEPERYEIPVHDGRYVRVVGHGNTRNSWNSITEVSIFGF